MKIVFYSSYPLFAGSQKMALQICEQMTKRNHETIALAPDETEYFKRARGLGLNSYFIKAPKPMLNFHGKLKKSGPFGKVFFVMFGLLPFTIKAYFFLRKVNPDVVYAAQPRAAVEIGLACKLAGIPIVFHVQSGLQKKLTSLYKLANALSKNIVAVSYAIADDIKHELGKDAADKTTVIYNGLRDMYINLDLPATQNSTTTLLFVGTYVPEKGLHHLIRAFAEIPEKSRKKMVLQAAGLNPDEEYTNYITDLSRELGIQEQVILLGFREDIPELINDADIIITPSIENEELIINDEKRVINWKEGFCLAALEGMRAAKPVIASRTYGLKEVVIDQETGLLVPPGDHQALRIAIENLSDNKSLGKILGQAGRVRFKNVFSLKKMSDEFEHIFNLAHTRRL